MEPIHKYSSNWKNGYFSNQHMVSISRVQSGILSSPPFLPLHWSGSGEVKAKSPGRFLPHCLHLPLVLRPVQIKERKPLHQVSYAVAPCMWHILDTANTHQSYRNGYISAFYNRCYEGNSINNNFLFCCSREKPKTHVTQNTICETDILTSRFTL